MANNITNDIKKSQEEFDEAYVRGKADVEVLKKQYVSVLAGGKEVSDGLKSAGMALAERRKELDQLISIAEDLMRTAPLLNKRYDMLMRQAQDAEKYLLQLRQDKKDNEKRYKAGADDKKIKLEAEAMDKALAKAERDYAGLYAELDMVATECKDPIGFFRRFRKERWDEALAEYAKALADFNESLNFFAKFRGSW